MSRKLRSLLAPGTVLVALAGAASPAAADGLPVPFDGAANAGVPSLDGDYRYSAVSGGRSTTALRITTGTGEIQRSLRLRGDFAVPLVAYDSTPSGLSADGRTLALIEPRRRFPRARTTFALAPPSGAPARRATSPADGSLATLHRAGGRDELSVQGDHGTRVLFAARGSLSGPTWSPDGRWLLLGWPRADQWLFIPAERSGRVIAIDRVSEQFDPGDTGAGAFPRVSGWILPQR
jgi:WD40-like Beta Propeller Repeat